MKNRPAICVLLTALLLLSGCTMWREHPGSTKWTDATGGEGLERSFWKEVKDKKWNELGRHMAGNFIGGIAGPGPARQGRRACPSAAVEIG